MIYAKDLRYEVIQPTLDDMSGLWPGAATPAAVNLLLGTAMHESTWHNATRLRQVGAGPALGIYQIEPATDNDTYATYLNTPGRSAKRIFVDGYSVGNQTRDLTGNLLYQTVIARLKYWRCSFTWPTDPDDTEALAWIWKLHYNTKLGKGEAADWLHSYERHCV